MGLCFSSSTSSCASSELSIENCDTLKSYKVDPGKLLCLPLLRDKKKHFMQPCYTKYTFKNC